MLDKKREEALYLYVFDWRLARRVASEHFGLFVQSPDVASGIGASAARAAGRLPAGSHDSQPGFRPHPWWQVVRRSVDLVP